MKLHEFMIPLDDGNPFDEMRSRDTEDAMSDLKDTAIKQKHEPRVTPRKNSNIAKAKRMRNLVSILKREKNQVTNDDTPHQYNLGGHTASFLNR